MTKEIRFRTPKSTDSFQHGFIAPNAGSIFEDASGIGTATLAS